LIRAAGRTQWAKFETIAHSLVDPCSVAAFVRRQGHHRIMDRGINHRHAFGQPFRPFPPKVEGTAREF
jgi:hypothetical protein